MLFFQLVSWLPKITVAVNSFQKLYTAKNWEDRYDLLYGNRNYSKRGLVLNNTLRVI